MNPFDNTRAPRPPQDRAGALPTPVRSPLRRLGVTLSLALGMAMSLALGLAPAGLAAPSLTPAPVYAFGATDSQDDSPDGADPVAALTSAPDGFLYGTTVAGGA